MDELYIVTGATGFIGGSIVRELLGRGLNVRCWVRDAGKARKVLGGLNADIMTGSLTAGGGFEKAFTGAEKYVLIHAAGLVALGGRKMDAQLKRDNTEATKYAVDTAKSAGAAKIIYISSVHAFKEPGKGVRAVEPEHYAADGLKGGYARTKAEATKYVLDADCADTETVTLHPSGVCGPYDPGETYLTKLILQYAAGKIPAGVKGGYDFVDVRDVAFAAAEAAKPGRRGCYFLTGNFATVKEILDHLSEHTGRKKTRLTMPMWAAKAALPFLTLYAKAAKTEPLYTAYSLSTLSQNASFSNERAAKVLGFTARPIALSIKDAVEFLKTEGRLYNERA